MKVLKITNKKTGQITLAVKKGNRWTVMNPPKKSESKEPDLWLV